jgi:predicted unusual protein kinase regulating ubiquinone biosynthesis (AarF/ABC1/UbiB family)
VTRRRVGGAAVVTLVAAAVVACGASGLRRRRGRLSTRRSTRNAQLALLGARVGAATATTKARQVFASAERREALRHDLELRTAQDVAQTLGQMKGALMKLGQLASFIDEGLPAPLREALAQLQQDAPPMSAALAAQVIEEELGAPPEQLFATWDPVPIAAASIGQVHRAITHGGDAVAVKVQYPGVAEAIAADLGNAGLAFGSLGLAFPGFDPAPLVAELQTRLAEELDYRNEANNLELFARFYAGHPFLHIPTVHRSLSSGRVLTTELAVGARFDEVVEWSQEQRDLAAEALFRFVFRSLYRLGAFNADPHPGNYLFRPDGRITFLDFGLVRHFTADELHTFESLIIAMVVRHDPAAFRTAVERAGLIATGAPVTTDQVVDYFSPFYAFVRDPQPLTWTPEYASSTVRHTFDPSQPVSKHATVPASFVLIQRINLGLYALLGRLRATADWRTLAEEMWPSVDGPASTELGRQETAWWATAQRMAMD